MININLTYSEAVKSQLDPLYVVPAITPLVDAKTGTYEFSLGASGIENADPAIGAAGLLTAIETDFTNNVNPTEFGLDSDLTVDVNLVVTSLFMQNDRSYILGTGTDSIGGTVTVYWVVN